MEDLTEAYLSVYNDIEEAKTPVTRRSMGIESQFVDKTGEEKAKTKAKELKNSTNVADRRRGNTITKKIETAADKEAAEAGLEARNRLLRRAKDRIIAARDMHEKRLFPGAPDYSHSFPLSDAERESARNIGKAAQAKAEMQASQSPTKSPAKKKKKLEFEVRENVYDLVLTHLLDEGYCDSQDSAIKMMAAMSQDWIDAIVEEFVDPEHGETPSGRTPLENVADHPKKSVRKKAVAGFKKQMGKEYGGEWKSKSNDAR